MNSTSSNTGAIGSDEFSLIREYFTTRTHHHPETRLGIGDDAALLQIPTGYQLVVSIDTMVEGVHFLKGTDPGALGHKLLAVNLSDLAAMGAEPRWVTLALTLPENNPQWLEPFSRGLFELAQRYNVDLVGGDTTRGPLTLTLQAHGIVPNGKAVTRSGAQPGDLICVTNTLGAAGYALQLLQRGENAEAIRHHLERPVPQIEAGRLLREQATAMVDLSDGLLADLGHITACSGVGAQLNLEALPLHPALSALSRSEQLDLAMTAGDEYQLCFTLSPTAVTKMSDALAAVDCRLTVIGEVVAQQAIHWDHDWQPKTDGYRHFQ